MKKITLFLVALLVSMTTFAANLVGGTTVYLKPSGDWNKDNARFAIYCWDDAAGEAWYDMQVTPNNPIIYSVTIPTGKDFTGFKFVRMNPATTENNWDNKWNETGNLTYDAAKTQYNVSGWDNGSWGEYTTPEKCTLTLVGDNTTLFGTAWSTDKTENDMTYSQSSKKWTKVYTLDLTGNLTGNYKVAYNHAWDYSWSNGDGDEGNTKLNLAISGEGKYRVTFTFDPATKQLSATIKKLIITIVEGTELYIQVPTTFTIASATVTFGKAASGNALGGASQTPITMTEVDETNQIWKVVAPAETSDSLFNVTLTNSSDGILKITNLKYDNTNNLFVLSEDVTFGTSRSPGSATEANGTWSVYEEEVVEPEPEPEDNATIVEGTKLYLKSYLGVASSSSYEYKVVFGEFTVPSSGGSTGGIIRSIAETATATEVAMTSVYTKEGKYNIWEVVAPAGTSDSIFTVIISRRNAVQGYITPLKYDGEHNLFQLPDGFSFPRNTNVVNETAGEWGVYVEGVDPDPDPELVGNIQAGLSFYFDFSANETWNALTGLKAKFTNSNGGTETVEMTQLEGSTIWNVVVPEGLWQSFEVGTFKIMAPSIKDLEFDGTNNLYTLDAEGNGTWSIYQPDYSGGETTNVENAMMENIFVQDAMIVVDGEYQIFTITGQNVTGMNGSLENGVYVVKSANAAVKVIVK